jgi:II/X family phage/plasmid replication protein
VIDWLTFVAPLTHKQGQGGPFFAGEILSTKPDPTADDGVGLDWGVWKRKGVEGSHSSKILCQSTLDEMGRSAIWVSGNPAKWFQGHNVFGSDDLKGLVLAMLHRICESVGVVPSADDLMLWDAGIIRLSRVDVTESYDLGNVGRVRNAIRSLDATANLKHRGRGHFKGDSITFGKGSRRWSLTFYAKGPELGVHPISDTLAAKPQLLAHADGLLRAEVRMLGLELTREHLEYVLYWSHNSASEVHQRMLAGLEIAEASMLDPAVLEALPLRLNAVYQLWVDGHDLRAMYPKNTFYRHRRGLLAFGIDIAVKQERRTPDMGNVVPLRVVFTARPAEVPGWAVASPLYFEPLAA